MVLLLNAEYLKEEALFLCNKMNLLPNYCKYILFVYAYCMCEPFIRNKMLYM